jgi:hypothetical protein
LAPIHVRINTIDAKIQNFIFMVGLNLLDMFFLFERYANIKIEAANAMTPPNLEGIDRRIA